MNSTAMLPTFPNDGYWLTITKPKSLRWCVCSCSSTMPLYSVSVTSSVSPSTKTIHYSSSGPYTSLLFPIVCLVLPTDLAVCSVSIAVPRKCWHNSIIQYPQLTSNNTTHRWDTMLCLGISVGNCGAFVWVTLLPALYMSDFLSWAQCVNFWPRDFLWSAYRLRGKPFVFF